MKGYWAIPIIASILILGAFTVGYSFDDAFAGKDDNNGNKGCEKSNPKSKACEKNPNTEPSGNLIIFIHEDNIGISGIECAVHESTTFCPHQTPILDQGTTDENGVLSLTIPSGLSSVTVACILVESPFQDEFWFVDVTEPITKVDLAKGDGDGTGCCPT